MACEIIAETEEPLSRQSLADLVRRAQATLGKKISRSTVWRMLHEAAIKPWQYEHWLFPKDPQFAEKAGPILDLYAGMWEGKSLGPTDYVLSMDEKTSIQARGRKHEETPPQPKQTRRIEAEYKRNGALQYLAAWDVHRGIVLGRCEKKTGIKPFGLLVDQVLEQDPYKDATQLFFIVDNGSSHRGQASVERMRRRDKRIVLVHTPIHASWLNQVEIYFSIIQRKVLTPERFCEAGSDPRALGVIRGVEQPHTETVRMEIHSTRHAELAKTCIAAFSSSFCCVGKRNRPTTTLFVKRTT